MRLKVPKAQRSFGKVNHHSRCQCSYCHAKAVTLPDQITPPAEHFSGKFETSTPLKTADSPMANVGKRLHAWESQTPRKQPPCRHAVETDLIESPIHQMQYIVEWDDDQRIFKMIGARVEPCEPATTTAAMGSMQTEIPATDESDKAIVDAHQNTPKQLCVDSGMLNAQADSPPIGRYKRTRNVKLQVIVSSPDILHDSDTPQPEAIKAKRGRPLKSAVKKASALTDAHDFPMDDIDMLPQSEVTKAKRGRPPKSAVKNVSALTDARDFPMDDIDTPPPQPVVTKAKRGRPPKAAVKNVSALTDARDFPMDDIDTPPPQPVVTKAKRGRPLKSAVKNVSALTDAHDFPMDDIDMLPQSEVTKRKRGRPPKASLSSVKISAEDLESPMDDIDTPPPQPEAIKAKRGRPPKSVLSSVCVSSEGLESPPTKSTKSDRNKNMF